MIFIVGGNGRLGRAIASEYAIESPTLVDRATYADWWQENSCDKVSRYFDALKAAESVVFVTSGLLDPQLPSEELLKVNFHLPKNIIGGAARVGIKVVTFGTVMEGLLTSANSYVRSKARLGEYVAEVGAAKFSATHLRIHTLYGVGAPSSFMFLGQILDAILRRVPFAMTLGKQLREYHHVQDEAKAIRKIAASRISGVLDVSHGRPTRLREIAEHLFRAFDVENLLRIGALPEPLEENYGQVFARPEILADVHFRDSLPSIVDYIKCSARPHTAG